MAEISILVVEDEDLFADKIEMLLDKLDYHLLATVDNSRDALNEINKSLPDLILMDIHIQGEYDGIELANMIQQKSNIPILFMTSLQDDLTFKRASRTKPVGFLAKPFNDLQLQRSIELVINQLELKKSKILSNEIFTTDHFFIKHRQKFEKVSLKDIAYLEADGRYTQIITVHKKYLIRKSLQKIKKQLEHLNFFQTHRSFVLNMDLVVNVNLDDSTVLVAGFNIPLSKRSKEAFLRRLKVI